jgi:predicted HNH restriction endonuclease
MYPSTWKTRAETANRLGREGPNLIVYRTKSLNARDHHVIPHEIIRNLVVEETITYSKRDQSLRWNLNLADHKLRVTHRAGKVDVRSYYGAPLIHEDSDVALPEEIGPGAVYVEGVVRRIQINAYERDREARKQCINHYGRRCFICKTAFAEVYGPAAASIIHVHHLVPLSNIRGEYIVNPIKDLRPVCPNCHAVIHSRTPVYEIEEVVEMLNRPH